MNCCWAKTTADSPSLSLYECQSKVLDVEAAWHIELYYHIDSIVYVPQIISHIGVHDGPTPRPIGVGDIIWEHPNFAMFSISLQCNGVLQYECHLGCSCHHQLYIQTYITSTEAEVTSLIPCVGWI